MSRLTGEFERYLGHEECPDCGAVGGDHKVGCPGDYAEVHVHDREHREE